MAVVLSGFLDDGAAGAWAVKTCGGTIFVQDPTDAQAANMPRNAMQTLDANHCLPVEQIGPLLTKLVETPLLDGGIPSVPGKIKRETGFA